MLQTKSKNLPEQTALATDDIKTRIIDIQSSTNNTIDDVSKIAEVINNVSEIVSIIATEIEEQSLVTKEISTNINEANTGVKNASERTAHSNSIANKIAKDIPRFKSIICRYNVGKRRNNV